MSNLNNNTASLQAILETINALPEEVVLPTLTNEGTASDMLSGKELINSSGKKVTGTIATKTSSDLTTSGATVTVPSGYYASQVAVAPPTIVLFVNDVEFLHFSYKRYLENKLREAFGFNGTPVHIIARKKEQ